MGSRPNVVARWRSSSISGTWGRKVYLEACPIRLWQSATTVTPPTALDAFKCPGIPGRLQDFAPRTPTLQDPSVRRSLVVPYWMGQRYDSV